MLWRACRGNVFLRQAEIEDPLEGVFAFSTAVCLQLINLQFINLHFFQILMPKAKRFSNQFSSYFSKVNS